jgi:LysM repeat protein
VRLTRRGRALVRSAILLVVVLVALVVTVASRADDVTPVASRSMVVSEHDTLWTIATDAAPDQPRSVTMAEIRELNHMSGNTVRVGQRLLLPAASR